MEEKAVQYKVGSDTKMISCARVFDGDRQMDCTEIVDLLNASHTGKVSPDANKVVEERIKAGVKLWISENIHPEFHEAELERL